MEDKKAYIKNLAEEDWDCGHPFGSDDFRYFQRLCKDDNIEVDESDWNYYWECFNNCKEDYYNDDDYGDDNSLQESCEGMSDKWNEGYSAFYNEVDYDDYPPGLTKEEIFEWQTGWDYARQEDMDISDKYDAENEFHDPYDGINEDELLFESGTSRHAFAGKISSGGNTALGIIGHGMYRDIGSSNLDFFGSHIIDEIKANLENITCKVGGKNKVAIDMDRTELSIDKDPVPGESVRERRIRGWVYFKHNFNITQETRQVLKQKVIQAFQGGKADFNDKYKSSHLVIRDFVSIPESFKYGNDAKSMYFVFKATQENFKNEPEKFIIHKQHTKESNLKEIFESIIDDEIPFKLTENEE